MTIENQIRDYLHSNLKQLDTKSRDIELIIYYYGFKDDRWPTLEDAAIKFNVGEPGGRRSERPRQIVNSKFLATATLVDIPPLKLFSDHLKSADIHHPSKLNAFAKDNSLFEANINTYSALRLLHDFNDCIEYRAYLPDLSEAPRSAIVSKQELIIINDIAITNARKALRLAKTIPGLLGIARLAYLSEATIAQLISYEDILAIIKLDHDSWLIESDNLKYYLFESRDNTLINSLEKIKSIADHVDVDRLSAALRNSLDKRTAPNKREYPPTEVIRHYLTSSKHIGMHENDAFINLGEQALTEVESDVVKYLTQYRTDSYSEISKYLLSLNYGAPLISKAISYSPLIYVDTSKGRRHYKYQIIGSKAQLSNSKVDRYEEFRQRLLELAKEGTDGDQEIIVRREQHVLSEWLFKGRLTEECAICKKTYSIKSLRTAHKKKRADCAENERTDPHIVMPLCVFGCDYIYEERLVYILANSVTSRKPLSLHAERDYIASVEGNILASQWTAGSDSYFPRPDE